MKPYLTIGLLVISNIFMTFAWYGQLRLKGQRWFDNLPLLAIILLCWGVALFEYMFQVPANRIGFRGNGGPFTLFQLKVIQEVVSLTVFTVFALVFLKPRLSGGTTCWLSYFWYWPSTLSSKSSSEKT